VPIESLIKAYIYGKICEPERVSFARFQHLVRATPEQFGLGAVLLHTNTPSLRVVGIEDDDEDEDEAPSDACFEAGEYHNDFPNP
jgi:hypothetical protein